MLNLASDSRHVDFAGPKRKRNVISPVSSLLGSQWGLAQVAAELRGAQTGTKPGRVEHSIS